MGVGSNASRVVSPSAHVLYVAPIPGYSPAARVHLPAA